MSDPDNTDLALRTWLLLAMMLFLFWCVGNGLGGLRDRCDATEVRLTALESARPEPPPALTHDRK